ncbi:MAG: hypothetical protein JWN04_777 [Myxococcaceae bacterium]|nr:hypothetical protein [Myxococcaceae bacterium]
MTIHQSESEILAILSRDVATVRHAFRTWREAVRLFSKPWRPETLIERGCGVQFVSLSRDARNHR